MKTVFGLMMALACTAGTAHAGSSLSFSEVKDACTDPARFQNQVAPKNLQVTCEERLTKWIPVPSNTVELPKTREITSSLSSDKYTVSPTVHPMSVENQQVSCPRYKEVLETVNFTKATSCDELLEFKGDEQDFCEDILDKVRMSNPKGVQVSDTGNTKDLCDAPAQEGRGQREQRGQRGQRGW